ncbi:MAG: rhodanese-like domain-containing protein [Alphaproteobacteria bacterium]|nr:rhodanese-like domain-containing protein [Alphaproteobacteria bacterium]
MNNKFIQLLCVLAFLYFLFVHIIPAFNHKVRGKNVKFVSADDLNKQLSEKQDLLMIDIRTRDEFYNMFGHIDHAINLPYGEFLLKLSENIDSFTDFKNTKIVIIGLRDEKTIYDAYNAITQKGFNNVYVLEHGISNWLRAQYPTVERNVKNN